MSEWNQPDRIYRLMEAMQTELDAMVGKIAMAGTHLYDPERLMECLNVVNVSAKQLLDIVNSMLEMSRLSNTYQEYADEPFQLGQFFASTIAFAMPEAERKHQQLFSFNCGVLHEQVFGDLHLLQNACMRIIKNAIQYTEEGGTINVRLKELPQERDEYAHYQFQVEDTGIGMTPEAIEKALSLYAKDHLDADGSRLGFPVAMKIIQKLDGEIHIESTVGKGTTVTADFFLKRQKEDENSKELSGKKVLIYERSHEAEEELKMLLEQLGAECTCILDRECLEEHLRMCAPGSYDMTFVNRAMADPDVTTFLKELRRKVGDVTYIILVSPFTRKETSFEAEAAGADGYIQRPLYRIKLQTFLKNMESIRKERRKSKAADSKAEGVMEKYFY